jgi:histidyl-tRNA synthetase
MSVGLDRLMAALTQLGAVSPVKTTAQVLVVTLGKKIAKGETLRLAAELRAAGLRVEAYFDNKMRMGDQLSHADRQRIPVAVIIGEDELERGEVAVKDLGAGKELRKDIEDRDEYREAGKTGQVTVSREEMIARVMDLLRAGQES